MSEWLQQEVCRRIELYCIDMGYAEAPGENSFIPKDAVTTFGIASHIANVVGCTHYVVVAPRGHIYGYFFKQFGCKVMEVYVSPHSGDVQVIDDLSSIRKRRVFIIEDNVVSEAALPSVVNSLLPYEPAEICLFVGDTNGERHLDNVPPAISQVFLTDQIYNFISPEQLEKDFTAFFAYLVPAAIANTNAEATMQPKWAQTSYNIGKTLKPFFKRLKQVWESRAEIDHKRFRNKPGTIRVGQNNIADNTSFLYFMMNLFKPGCMSHISVRPGLALPLSLMLLLKYSRGIQQAENRKKALFISLTHPIEIAENVMAHCLRRSVKPMLNGKILDRDWPYLTRAAGEVYDLCIDFWKEDVFFETDFLKHILQSSEWPYGLVVINDSTGRLEEDSYGTINPLQQLKSIRLLATALNIPVIVINSSLQKDVMDTDVFDHIAQLSDDVDRYQLFISKSNKSAYGKLTFVMSRKCNILEDALSNFTQTKPANYNSWSE